MSNGGQAGVCAIAHTRIIPHCDGAGEIVDIGPGVENRKTGDRVWMWNAQGAIAGLVGQMALRRNI